MKRPGIYGLAVLATVIGACSKEIKKGDPDAFAAPLGSMIEPVCTKDNDGQRFSLEGYFGLPGDLDVDEKNRTSVNFYFDTPDSGRSVKVAAIYQEQVQLQSSGPKKRAAGFNRTEVRADPDSFRVLTNSGPVTAREKVRATIRLQTSENFETHAVMACKYHLVTAEKL
ncbi:MAG: hypothetical protein H7Y89_14435 [Steroidobacteraceae bacterium]|nr:hypothetical protein [Steroidobacteraceae bacterium]